MIRWEYHDDLPTCDKNALGREGWNLVGFSHNGMAVFKRPLRDAPSANPPVFYASHCDAEGCDGSVRIKDGQWCCDACGKSFGPAPPGALMQEMDPCPSERSLPRKKEGSGEFDGWIGGTRVREVLD